VGQRVSSPASHRLLTLVLASLLAGCTAPADRGTISPDLASAEQVARMIAGRYAGRSPIDDEASGAPDLVRLDARVERIATGGVETLLSQRTGDGPARTFMLTFRPTAVATRLEGSFSPLDAQGRPAGACPLEVSVQRDGFIARTDADTCRFGVGGEEVALIKEIAHDGDRLVIGDRVVNPGNGETLISDRVLQLERVRSFSGWVGVRDAGANHAENIWRVADEISMDSDGLGLDPADVAGMPLGVTLDLAPYRVRDGGSVLRLRVFDNTTGDLLGQAWADPLATRIGLALSGVQVGLQVRDGR